MLCEKCISQLISKLGQREIMILDYLIDTTVANAQTLNNIYAKLESDIENDKVKMEKEKKQYEEKKAIWEKEHNGERYPYAYSSQRVIPKLSPTSLQHSLNNLICMTFIEAVAPRPYTYYMTENGRQACEFLVAQAQNAK